MEKGLKTLMSAARPRRNKDSPNSPTSPQDRNDDFDDSSLPPSDYLVGSEVGTTDPQSGGFHQSNQYQTQPSTNPQHIILDGANPVPLNNVQDVQTLHDQELNNQKLQYDELQRASSRQAHPDQTLQGKHDKLLADYARLQAHCETAEKALQLLNIDNNTLAEDRSRLQDRIDSLDLQLEQDNVRKAQEGSAVILKDCDPISHEFTNLPSGLPVENQNMRNAYMLMKRFWAKGRNRSSVRKVQGA